MLGIKTLDCKYSLSPFTAYQTFVICFKNNHANTPKVNSITDVTKMWDGDMS
jgi:hypothetical protein